MCASRECKTSATIMSAAVHTVCVLNVSHLSDFHRLSMNRNVHWREREEESKTIWWSMCKWIQNSGAEWSTATALYHVYYSISCMYLSIIQDKIWIHSCSKYSTVDNIGLHQIFFLVRERIENEPLAQKLRHVLAAYFLTAFKSKFHFAWH